MGKSPLHVSGMHGLGDSLHQRAILRLLMQTNEVWLDTSWASVYWDLVEQGLHVVHKPSPLRTQAKNAQRKLALGRFTREPIPPGTRSLRINYRPRADQTVLEAMCEGA